MSFLQAELGISEFCTGFLDLIVDYLNSGIIHSEINLNRKSNGKMLRSVVVLAALTASACADPRVDRERFTSPAYPVWQPWMTTA